jgi:iron complex transport system substrate-binding protein
VAGLVQPGADHSADRTRSERSRSERARKYGTIAVMRIVSLLPSATEIAFDLGLGDALVGVTHECDYPPEASTKTVVSHSTLPTDATDPAEVDRLVSGSIGAGQPIYRLDAERFAALQPDVILTQDLCRVCAVPTGHVEEALDRLGCDADVVSLDPSSIDEVIDCLVAVGRATGTEPRSTARAAALRRWLDDVRHATAGLRRPSVLALEWSDPPFNGGHWVPEMIDAAGGSAVLADAGAPSRRLSWGEIEGQSPEVVVFMPCGYDLDRAVAEGGTLLTRSELEGASAVFAVDASSYFSRPGPRLVDGVEVLAWALHPDRVPAPPPGRVEQLR